MMRSDEYGNIRDDLHPEFNYETKTPEGSALNKKSFFKKHSSSKTYSKDSLMFSNSSGNTGSHTIGIIILLCILLAFLIVCAEMLSKDSSANGMDFGKTTVEYQFSNFCMESNLAEIVLLNTDYIIEEPSFIFCKTQT